MRKILTVIWRVITFPFQVIFWILRAIWNWATSISKSIRFFLFEEPDEAPLADTIQKAVEYPNEILGHLDELRKHLFRAVVALLITTVISFAFTPQILEILTSEIGGLSETQAIDLTEPIGVYMRVALLTGFALALPYIILELWLFVGPGLSRRARLIGLLSIPMITVFFVGGMAFAYFFMLPTAVPVLRDFLDIPVKIRPSSYIRFVTGLMFWIGLAFELPVVSYFLAAMRIVSAKTLLQQSRLAVVILAVFAAAITPTVDPINMLLVLGPLLLLYFLSVGLAFLAQIGRKQQTDVV